MNSSEIVIYFKMNNENPKTGSIICRDQYISMIWYEVKYKLFLTY
jgi:hypothetical protein